MSTQTIPFVKHQAQDLRLPPVYVTYVTIQKTWTLVDAYRVTLRVDDREEIRFEIPMGFNFDLASIPRFIWPLISSFELSLIAPLIHDYCYRYRGLPVFHRRVLDNLPVPDGVWHNITRAEADKLFLDLMLREGVPTWKARAAYAAVRIFAPRW